MIRVTAETSAGLRLSSRKIGAAQPYMNGARPVVVSTLPAASPQWSFADRSMPTLSIDLSVASRVRRMIGFHQRGESASPIRNGGLPEAGTRLD
jgi:hypothetical protein